MSYPGYSGSFNPTIHPIELFDPVSDGAVVREAVKARDEKGIINVLARRSNIQRQEIASQFGHLHGKDLISSLESKLSGNFKNLMVAMMKPHSKFMAKEIHDAPEDKTLMEVICSSTNAEIHSIKSAYRQMYERDLESDWIGDTASNFGRLMVSLCMGNRCEDNNVDPVAAQADAQALLRAGAGTDESVFSAVICQRSYPQLRAVLQEYQQISGQSLFEAVKNDFPGAEEGILTILKCLEHRPAYFAERLYKSMKGLGTDDRSLIRLVVSRSEIDMADIKAAFEDAYDRTLASFIEGDTSGNYSKCLLALIGEY